jgi:tau tubulin kinase
MDKEVPKISDRFQLQQKLGQGTFSYIWQAYDTKLEKNVALKIEKKDKSKNILRFEYQVLQHLKDLQHVPNAFGYVQGVEQNLIVMDLLGSNLAKARRILENRYDLRITIQILMEMVVAVREVHRAGFIHRDVKASNFVLCTENARVFIVDFGLAKKHLGADHEPVAKRKSADFRGTVSFASLNAHNNVDLARRDDLWSLYFSMLDFLNEKLEWREQRDFTIV